MSSDGMYILSAIGAISMTTLLIQFLSKNSKYVDEYRKLLHWVALNICAWTIISVQNTALVGWLLVGFTIPLFLAVVYKTLYISQGKSFGIAFFPFAIGSSLLFGVSPEHVVTATLVLAWADPIAGLVGKNFGEKIFVPLKEQKTMIGSSAFFMIAFAILLWRSDFDSALLSSCFFVALALTFSEMFSWRGSDNLSIVWLGAVYIPLIPTHSILIHQLWYWLVLAFIFYGLVSKTKALTPSGGLAALFLAFVILSLLHWSWTLLPILFLSLGTLLSKWNKSILKDQDASQGRNSFQVLANGGVALIITLFYGMTDNDQLLLVYSISFAAALSDTCSSEVGRRFKGKTIDILSLKKIQPGLSGGVSLSGTVAGLIGALIIGICVSLFYGIQIGFFVSGFGFLGMIIDSLLGSSLQAKYKNDVGNILEIGSKDNLTSGLHFINNDGVNFISILLTCILAWFCLYLFH